MYYRIYVWYRSGLHVENKEFLSLSKLYEYIGRLYMNRLERINDIKVHVLKGNPKQ